MDKIAVITGATDGIGYHTALALAQQGMRVVQLARNATKAKATRRAIEAAVGRPCVEDVACDLGDLDAVRRAAADVLERCPRIDVLVNNAGGAMGERGLSPQGHELTHAVNHLGGYLLTRLLLDRMLEAQSPRIVFSASQGHRISALDFDDLEMERGWTTMKAYGRSKLMNVLTAMELHRRYGAQGLAASSMHPGGVRTGIWKKAGPLGAAVGIIGAIFMVSAEKGSDTLTWLASSPDAAKPEGRYYIRRKVTKTASFATPEAADRLWDVSTALVGA